MDSLINDLRMLGSPQKAEHLQRFFKTGVGQYAQGDIFWGITVPMMRKIAHKYKNFDVNQLEELLEHAVHEVRLCALLIMVLQVKIAPEEIFNLYLKKTRFVNNWDLVDLSAPAIAGSFLLGADCSILYSLARSELVWDRRIAIISTYAFIKHGRHEHTLNLARFLIHDSHDLIHKAVGWMLREVGKRCSLRVLEEFLEEYAAIMPRTMLRYSIEHFATDKRNHFMEMKKKRHF